MTTKRWCYPCSQSGQEVLGTLPGCKHLASELVGQDRGRFGICSECFAAGECPECGPVGTLVKGDTCWARVYGWWRRARVVSIKRTRLEVAVIVGKGRDAYVYTRREPVTALRVHAPPHDEPTCAGPGPTMAEALAGELDR